MNITKAQVVRQLQAMDTESFEVGVFDPEIGEAGKMLIKHFDYNTVIKSLKYLRYMNSNRNHIFVRPATQNGLIFFDDFSRADLQDLEAKGVNITVCIQSSPQNFQGWIRVCDGGISNEEATSISQFIAKQYGGDFNSADWRHFGRLAGFTNCKPKYVDDFGRFPFCKLDSVSNVIGVGNAVLKNKGLEYHKEKIEKEAERLEALKARIVTNEDSVKASSIFAEVVLLAKESLQDKYNASRADWRAVLRLSDLGFSVDAIASAMLQESEKANRSGIDGAKYVETTLKKAFG